MDIALPREPRPAERRVALNPSGVKALTQHGHRVWVEHGAGAAAGHGDEEYEAAGARIAYSRMEVFARAELVTGIYAPPPAEYDLLRSGQAVFAFWALPAAAPEQFQALQEREITALAIEATVDSRGRAPVVTSMSEIAGGLALSIGGTLLLNEYGGPGILLGGAPGVPPADVLILGAGVLGRSAARAALGAGAQVTLLDVSVEHLREASQGLAGPVRTMLATQPNLEHALAQADLILGAAAVRGQRTPILVPRSLLGRIRARRVVMDFSVDMGGCFETSRPTYFPHPTFEVDGVVHFCVPNVPSCAARSATLAFTNAVLPYLLRLADLGLDQALAQVPDLRAGACLHHGRCVAPALARIFQVECQPLGA